jgi:hypothetical protein
VYATIEAVGDERFLPLRTRESWGAQRNSFQAEPEPHYYQEIEASQVNPNLVYQMDDTFSR